MDLNTIGKNSKTWAAKLLAFGTQEAQKWAKNVLGARVVSAWLKFYHASKHQMPKV